MFGAIVLTICYVILYTWSLISIYTSVKLKKKNDPESPEQFFSRCAKEAWLAAPFILATMITSCIQVLTIWAEVLNK